MLRIIDSAARFEETKDVEDGSASFSVEQVVEAELQAENLRLTLNEKCGMFMYVLCGRVCLLCIASSVGSAL